jgi:hypothetical protein
MQADENKFESQGNHKRRTNSWCCVCDKNERLDINMKTKNIGVEVPVSLVEVSADGTILNMPALLEVAAKSLQDYATAKLASKKLMGLSFWGDQGDVVTRFLNEHIAPEGKPLKHDDLMIGLYHVVEGKKTPKDISKWIADNTSYQAKGVDVDPAGVTSLLISSRGPGAGFILRHSLGSTADLTTPIVNLDSEEVAVAV